MIETLENLIRALREELQQYGEMLARLDQQQELVTRRATGDVLQSTEEIEAQLRVIHSSRGQRLARQREMALALQLADDASFSELLPRLPHDYRPLVAALVQENNELLVRVQQRSRQNHVLLSRAVELMSRLINSLIPGGGTVYPGSGSGTNSVFPAQTFDQAIG